MEKRGEGFYRISFPHAMSGEVTFFEVSPPFPVRGTAEVEYAAQVADSAGCGFNLLLIRRKDEQYGEWLVCQVRTNPLTGFSHPSCKYFGLASHQMNEIEKGLRAVAMYVPELKDDVATAIDGFVESLFLPPSRY
jgi:hypothetical protein